MSDYLEPGARLGVLGSGQLGRMFALAARRMGYRVHVFSPDVDSPTGQLADVEVSAAYEDHEALAAFARGVDVVTFEFENIPVETTRIIERFAPVRPGGHVLHTTQNRLREKTFLREAGLPVTPFWPIRSLEDLVAGGRCGILKTSAWGYDGKGQVRIDSPAAFGAAWEQLGTDEAILEERIDFECEVSVVAARGRDGELVHYGPIRNRHSRHILDVSTCPAGLPDGLAAEAIEIARLVLEKLEVVGVLCVEFFVTREGRLLINELAPRPHNSGHLTIDAHATCQFEQQLRAVCGLPLGSTEQLRPAAMANLLGDVWDSGPPDWSAAVGVPGVKLHLYGKLHPRSGRKMGHLTALGPSVESAQQRVLAARQRLVSAPQAAAPLSCE